MLYEQIGQEIFHWRAPDSFKAADFHRFAADEEVTVAAKGGALLGFLSFYRPQSFVHGLYIARSARGQGIGRALLFQAAANAADPLTLKCDVANDAALGFYAGLGFKPVERGSEDGVPWVLLRAPSWLARADERPRTSR